MSGFVMPPDTPRRIRTLPRNEAGYPVPWFVEYVDGKPDFRIMNEHHFVAAVKEKLCWICGEKMGAFKAFVIGPMCAVNRVSSEPPSHTDCAIFAAKMCPFLANPKQKRRETNLPGNASLQTAGIAIKRNPGVALVWITGTYSVFDDGRGGALFNLGEPINTFWYAQGREATREEIMESIDSGFPLLMDMAQREGPEAIADLNQKKDDALGLVPN